MKFLRARNGGFVQVGTQILRTKICSRFFNPQHLLTERMSKCATYCRIPEYCKFLSYYTKQSIKMTQNTFARVKIVKITLSNTLITLKSFLKLMWCRTNILIKFRGHNFISLCCLCSTLTLKRRNFIDKIRFLQTESASFKRNRIKMK